jgi:hypothetical protein
MYRSSTTYSWRGAAGYRIKSNGPIIRDRLLVTEWRSKWRVGCCGCAVHTSIVGGTRNGKQVGLLERVDHNVNDFVGVR